MPGDDGLQPRSRRSSSVISTLGLMLSGAGRKGLLDIGSSGDGDGRYAIGGDDDEDSSPSDRDDSDRAALINRDKSPAADSDGAPSPFNDKPGSPVASEEATRMSGPSACARESAPKTHVGGDENGSVERVVSPSKGPRAARQNVGRGSVHPATVTSGAPRQPSLSSGGANMTSAYSNTSVGGVTAVTGIPLPSAASLTRATSFFGAKLTSALSTIATMPPPTVVDGAATVAVSAPSSSTGASSSSSAASSSVSGGASKGLSLGRLTASLASAVASTGAGGPSWFVDEPPPVAARPTGVGSNAHSNPALAAAAGSFRSAGRNLGAAASSIDAAAEQQRKATGNGTGGSAAAATPGQLFKAGRRFT